MAEFRMSEDFGDRVFTAVAVCAWERDGMSEVDTLFATRGARGSLLVSLLLDTSASKRRRHGAVRCEARGPVALVFADPKAGWDPWMFANELSSEMTDMFRPVSRYPMETELENIFTRIDFPMEGRILPDDERDAILEGAVMASELPEARSPGRPAAKV